MVRLIIFKVKSWDCGGEGVYSLRFRCSKVKEGGDKISPKLWMFSDTTTEVKFCSDAHLLKIQITKKKALAFYGLTPRFMPIELVPI